jgi:hypothetical protein
MEKSHFQWTSFWGAGHADYEACNREKLAAADQLSNPRHSMLYPAYKRLVDMLAAIRLKCDEKWFAVRAHRKKMRDERK